MNGCRLLHTEFRDSNLEFANFDSAKLENVLFAASNLSEANLTNCSVKQVLFRESLLRGTSIFKTSFRGIDLTDCELENLVVSEDAQELRGVIVTIFQAAELARLLGVVVR